MLLRSICLRTLLCLTCFASVHGGCLTLDGSLTEVREAGRHFQCNNNDISLPNNQIEVILYDLSVSTIRHTKTKVDQVSSVHIYVRCLQQLSSFNMHGPPNAYKITQFTMAKLKNAVNESNMQTLLSSEYEQLTGTKLRQCRKYNQMEVVLGSEQSCRKGKVYRLSFWYQGELNKVVYSSETIPKYGYVLNFKLEYQNARFLYPGFDEPFMKARYKLEVHRSNDQRVVSMMNRANSSSKPCNMYADLFHITNFNVSPYTFTFVIIPKRLPCTKRESQNSVNVEVYHVPPSDLNISSISKTFIERQSRYLKDFPYPGNNHRAVLVPFESPFSAMEYWNIIHYNSKIIGKRVTDKQLQNDETEMFSCIILGHEVAHQWFGNLLTMEWWTEVWIKEGFSTLLSAITSNNICTSVMSYDIVMYFVTTRALTADIEVCKPNPAALFHEKPKEESKISSFYKRDIAYLKSAAILNYVRKRLFPNDSSWRKALKNLLMTQQNKAVSESDVWNSMDIPELTLSNNLSSVMHAWIHDPEYPLVSVRREGHQLKFKQKHMCSNNTNLIRWKTLVNVITNEGDVLKVWLTGTTEKSITINPATVWINANPGVIGVYKVEYENDMLNAITAHMRQTANLELQNTAHFSPIDREFLLITAFELKTLGLLTWTRLRDVLLYLKQEEHWLPWSRMYSYLTNLEEENLEEQSIQQSSEEFKSFVQSLYLRQWRRIQNSNIVNDLMLKKSLSDLVIFYGESSSSKLLCWKTGIYLNILGIILNFYHTINLW